MCSLGEEIPDNEKVVRAVKSPHHVNGKGGVKHNALRPPPDDSVISVIRHAMGDDFCKDQGKKVVEGDAADGESEDPPDLGVAVPARATFAGLLALPSGHVRECGSTVEDAREDFCGHAHVDHDLKMPPRGVPVSPELLEKLRERCKSIISGGAYFSDPAPDQPGWSGPAL